MTAVRGRRTPDTATIRAGEPQHPTLCSSGARTTGATSPRRANKAALRGATILGCVVLVAGCGLGFGAGEAHLAPDAPLLPPTTEPLGAPTMLLPATDGVATTVATVAPTPIPDPDAPGGEPTLEGNGGPSSGDGAGPDLLNIMVTGELAHDPTAFTQGLEISGGRLYESTGAPDDRSSSIRELDRASGEILRLIIITEDVFAEGLTFVDDRIYQLTWQAGVALVWDAAELAEVARFNYEGQGWGLCYDGRRLVMSDGSAELHFRDPVTFDRVGDPVTVTLDGEELPSLNELECVGDQVYANVWQTDLIVRIDPLSGRVTALADASDIGVPRPDSPDAVLNGIAWDPVTETFLIGGKDWPAIYEVTFEPATGAAGAAASPAPAAEDSPTTTSAPDS